MTNVHEANLAQAELLDALLTQDQPPQRRRWYVAALALVLVAVAGAVTVVLTRDAGPQGPPHPSAWDPKVQKYVDFVEKKRDLTFEHPVYVDFLPESEFVAQVTADDAEVTDEDRAELERATGMLRALGLVEGDIDLFDASNELNGEGIIGFYRYDDERLRVRGTELTPAVESVLVHELTHALQDQSFDLESRFQELDKADDANSEAASDGFHALVEGDARRIEGLWRDHLSAKARKALDQERAQESDGFESGAKDVPEVLVTMMGAPYALGEALLAVAQQQGGEAAIDNLFRSPPSTEEQQLDPWTLVADHQGYLTVPEPELPEGVEAYDDGAFGSVGWLMLLSERLPLEQALAAVDGWGGDAYAAYERDGVSCVSVNYRADSLADLSQMLSALRAWSAQGPRDAASVEKQDQTLVFRSCDPGAAAPKVAQGRTGEALARALSRTYISLELVKQGALVPVARCAAERLLREYTPAQLNSPKLDRDRVAGLLAPCRGSA
ncbi:MAG TPA: hypothetical protein PLZ93_13815 [Nocardioides sp.]|uniref:hypothetical protein n=1 Tax=uncultured Nocardioides sp. TaxID=198441 RepID=UPI000EEE575C|nr:hypothetical protein [uncultured Nocardioides sp.]HCB03635.1 hypothetical protein [Nocardioides sp.]HRD59577.1 hypothetical protein [Nocardioides sp.]HRI96687.1 hypothetical protein [Nocardioides sp.]HRK44741.1 hypothetical protein [Nocardioides sp.]